MKKNFKDTKYQVSILKSILIFPLSYFSSEIKLVLYQKRYRRERKARIRLQQQMDGKRKANSHMHDRERDLIKGASENCKTNNNNNNQGKLIRVWTKS